MPYPKRLIEVDLPIKRISAHARREKSIRQGHISTLHIWWARRPLAACRAVLCASLWPDPADENCSKKFIEVAKQEMLKWSDNDHLLLLSQESLEHFLKVNRSGKALNNLLFLRQLLLDFIADFSNWDNSSQKEFLKTCHILTQEAHVSFGGILGTRPLVTDPFAGGGAIPLEALRIGADSFASDLNPVPVLLNKILLEYLPKYGTKLFEEVKKWGDWVEVEAKKELAQFYPQDLDGSTPIAYLWARVIICEGPNCGATVPLIKSLWLGKKPHNSWCVKLLPNKKNRSVEIDIIQGVKLSENNAGTVRKGAALCPCCGYITSSKNVRKQFILRKGGTNDARLFCVVTTKISSKGRFYRKPTEADLEIVKKAQAKLESLLSLTTNQELIPKEPTPMGGGKGAGRAFSQRNYGINTFEDLFTKRQLLTLVTLVDKIQTVRQEILKSHPVAFVDAIQATLALNVDKIADYGSSLATWSSPASQETIRGTFSRQALSITWDFAEAYPFAKSSGGWSHNLSYLISPLQKEGNSFISQGNVERASAIIHPLPDDSVDAFVTDPPYYDAIPYADLSDFFIVWLKRSLKGTVMGNNFLGLSPKEEECVVDEIKGHDSEFFVRTMGLALREGRRVTKPGGIGLVVFAHKSTAGWEAQLQAMIDAGWIITGSWPIDTEREGRTRANSSAALASSVHLVCRPREDAEGNIVMNEIGDWRDVQEELPKRIHEWMPRLAGEGVVGADAIFACLGPALEVFSRYTKVIQAGSEKEVSLRDYLEKVWAAVSQEALNMVFSGGEAKSLEEDARLTAMWLWTLTAGVNEIVNGIDDDDDDEESSAGGKVSGYTLEYDTARKIAQGLGANLDDLKTLIEVKGDKARLLPVQERITKLFGVSGIQNQPVKKKRKTQLSFTFENLEPEEETKFEMAELKVEQTGKTVLDRLHQAMLLFSTGRTEALKRFLVEDGAGKDDRFWKLAQSLTALYPKDTDERRWVEAVQTYKKSLGF